MSLLLDDTAIISFDSVQNVSQQTLKSPNENHFGIIEQSQSPANVYRSEDCNEILEKELEQLNESDKMHRFNLVSQSSIEIEICDIGDKKIDSFIGNGTTTFAEV